MTIEEYCDNEIKKAETEEYANPFDMMEVAYRQIVIKLLKAIKEEILKLDHDATMREVKEMCQSHFRKDGCKKCPMHTSVCYCSTFGVPAYWEPDVIQKRMKEARK